MADVDENGVILNRYGTPEIFAMFDGKKLLSCTEAERYADAAIQRAGLYHKTLPEDRVEGEALVRREVLPQILAVLHDAGEIGHPPAGTKFAEDGREIAMVTLVAAAVGCILGFNKGAIEGMYGFDA